MLLCDECDRECHTYCQYPKLWEIPRGKWSCPICKEVRLLFRFILAIIMFIVLTPTHIYQEVVVMVS